jgi:hypothetical protein
MPSLILGPLLRYADTSEATVWVETSEACEVEILGRKDRTFRVAGHHYAIMILEGLEPGGEYEYDIRLDGELAWPEDGERQGMIRTPDADDELRLAFGTCRRSLPHEPPYTETKDQDRDGREVDSLYALSERMIATPEATWPDALMLIGDQIYADMVSPRTLRRIEARRSTKTGAGEQIADFEEYTWLYHESWGDPAVRWILATLPSAMVFDDHDVIDDWNTSGSWARNQRKKDWWPERLIGAYMSYWLYQHLGNLTPDELRKDRTLAALKELDGDGESILREFAARAAEEVAGTRWSFVRDFGRTRLLVLDTRAGRIIEDDAERQMLADNQWEWVSERITGDLDHLLIASSLPILMSDGLHHLEGWNEAVCAGAWGRWARWPAERIRRAVDLEHWPAFRGCFDRLVEQIESVGSGERGEAPASVILLSGDVHHAYLAEAEFPVDSEVTSRLVQAVCSPMRNPLDTIERQFMKAALSRSGSSFARLLARSAGVPRSPLRWEFVQPPTFDNQIGTVEIQGRASRVLIERTEPEDWRAPKLHESLNFEVTAAPAA